MDARFRRGNRPIADRGPVGHPHLAGQDHAIPELGAAGDAHLGRQGATAAGHHPMADVHQVVDLGAGADAGFAHRGAVDRAAAAHLHALFQHHQAGLGHLAPAAGGGHKAKALRAHHGVGVNDAARGQPAAGMQHGAGVELTALTHLHIAVDHHAGMEDRASPDAAARRHHPMGADMDAGADGGAGLNHGAGVDAGGRPLAGVEGVEGLGKGQARIAEGHPGQALGCGLLLQLRILGDQQGAGTAAGQGRRQGMARFEKTQLAHGCLVQGRGAREFGVARQVPGGGLLQLPQLDEQVAEAHGRARLGWRGC